MNCKEIFRQFVDLFKSLDHTEALFNQSGDTRKHAAKLVLLLLSVEG